MTLNSNPSLGLAPGIAAGPERGLGRDRKRGQKRRRHEDETGKEAGLGKERNPGLKWVGDTLFTPKFWAGAGDCCGAGTWTREGSEAWTT